MNKDQFSKLHEKYSELIDTTSKRRSDLLQKTGIGERYPTKKKVEGVLEWCEGGDTSSLKTHLTEAMDPAKAKQVIANMERGRSQCASKHKGNPAKIKGCQDRMSRIISGIKQRYNL